MFLHLVLMGKCLHILLSTPLSIYLIEIWASGHYTDRHGQEDVYGEVLAELRSAVWRGLGWAVVNHLLQLQSDKVASRQETPVQGLTTVDIVSVDIIYKLYLPGHNQWWPHPGAGGYSGYS